MISGNDIQQVLLRQEQPKPWTVIFYDHSLFTHLNTEEQLTHKNYEQSFSKHQCLDCSIDHWHISFLRIVSHLFQCVFFLWLDLLISWVYIFFHFQIFFKVQSFVLDLLGQVLFLLEKWTLCQLMGPSHLLHVFECLLAHFIGDQFNW